MQYFFIFLKNGLSIWFLKLSSIYASAAELVYLFG